MTDEIKTPTNFIRNIIDADLSSGKHTKIVTRFPPEPNGYLHIGHAKSICLNFGLAKDYQGTCHLRFDDTNPTKEENEYVNSIQEDIKWLGFDWDKNLYFASDYFDQLYDWAVYLIKQGKAYVCDLCPEDIGSYRGTGGESLKPGKDSPYCTRSLEENLALFEQMKKGAFKEGEKCLRARIDMSAPNLNLRDPVLYRILNEPHHRTGDKWHIYPMYDFAHGQSDAIEGITHSICTLEFEDHRPLYGWFLDNLPLPSRPRQIEFARLNLNYTVMSKRHLLKLVTSGAVTGWDDPRMPTLAGFRRRGYTPEAIRDLCERIGVAKAASVVDVAMLEHCLREDLNKKARRAMVVLNPLKVVITNYPEDKEEELDVPNNPEDENMGTRKVPFSRELYIERDDFMEEPLKKFFRLSPGKEVRFNKAYYITCDEVIKDDNGAVVALHCSYDPETRGGWLPGGRKVKGTLHWVSAKHAVKAEVRIFENLFVNEDPYKELDESGDPKLNPNSLQVINNSYAEAGLKQAVPGDLFQFLRHGYFVMDKDSSTSKMVFNRSVSLKDSWKKDSK
jgi:glutaminyl-tRNA synthetase